MFWDAIVTRNKGSATPTRASRVKVGVTSTKVGARSGIGPASAPGSSASATTAATSAAGTA